MDATEGTRRHVRISGTTALVDRLREPVQQALAGRRSLYLVEIASIGRVGEILVSITGSNGRLPLLFAGEDLEPAHVRRVVTDTVSRFEV